MIGKRLDVANRVARRYCERVYERMFFALGEHVNISGRMFGMARKTRAYHSYWKPRKIEGPTRQERRVMEAWPEVR